MNKRDARNPYAVRLTDDLLENVALYQGHLRLLTPGVKVTFSDALRALIYRGLEAEEQRRAA